MNILELHDVSYSYIGKFQQVDAIRHIHCSFEQGKVYAIVGKSGSGKSTLLSLLAGLDVPASGQLLFEGQLISTMDLAKYRRECAAMIYQSFRLFPLLTVSENITYPMELRGFKGKKARERARSLAARVALPETLLDRFPNMLSGGEQQRVGIARAMSMDTRLLLADEPTGNLDEENSCNIIDILVELAHRDGYCVIIATHDLGILPRVDVVFRMNSGILRRETAGKDQTTPITETIREHLPSKPQPCLTRSRGSVIQAPTPTPPPPPAKSQALESLNVLV